MAGIRLLGLLNTRQIDKEHVGNLGVGKTVDDGTAQPNREAVVDKGADECANCAEKDNKWEREYALMIGNICSRNNDNLAWERDKGALDSHEQGDDTITHVLGYPVINFFHFYLLSFLSASLSPMASK